MKIKLTLLIGSLLLTGCNLSISTVPTPTPLATTELTLIPTETATAVPLVVTETSVSLPLPTNTPVVVPTATVIPPVNTNTNICTDPQVTALIDSLKRAILNADGPLLSSLVSPNGMEVRYFRNGNAITYSPYQAQFLFETTFPANWGAAPGSGLEKKGSFHDVVVPDLVKVFNAQYTLQCNEIPHGGATYDVRWPYNKDFYSIYDAGTQQNANMDWHTWVVGIEYVNGKPYIYALTQFFWEP